MDREKLRAAVEGRGGRNLTIRDGGLDFVLRWGGRAIGLAIVQKLERLLPGFEVGCQMTDIERGVGCSVSWRKAD